jgi:two-component system phosphate regulon sensor histidine kinase PhoR
MAAQRGAAERLEAAIDALPFAVVVVDSNGTIERANARAREFLALAGPAVPSIVDAVVARCLLAGQSIREETALRTSGGETLALELHAVPVTDGAVCTIEDLTERSTRERADRDFITNAAHQLRTPITAIATAVEVLQGGAKEIPEARDRFLQHIELHSQRLVRLARAMLVLARAERGDIGPSLGLIPLQPLLEGLVAEIPAGAGVAIAIDCPPTAAVVADEALLSEALSNLLANALVHSSGRTVHMRVVEDDVGVVLEIADTGTGIAADDLDRVFERFHRGSTPGDGAGLGLPIAKAAIEVQGGSLELDSAFGQGTTVRVRFASA